MCIRDRLYADEGITGTSAKKRKAFLQMIRDCERGKIDLVITKSVSRFCRNTLDGLNYVRRLKRHGVGVYFEKENVNTLFMDNEMILTFMMSQAQAESESLSGNVRSVSYTHLSGCRCWAGAVPSVCRQGQQRLYALGCRPHTG